MDGTPQHWNDRGISFARAGELEAAKNAFENALQLEPDFADALNNFGLLLLHLKNPEKALQHLTQAIAVNPNFALAHNNLGNAFTALGKLEEALSAFDASLAIDNSYIAALKNKVITLWRLGWHPEQAEVSKKLLDVAPNMVDGAFYLAMAYIELGRCREAYELLLKIKQSSGENTAFEIGLGRAAQGFLSGEVAARHFGTALRLEPQNLWAKTGLAVAIDSAGNHSEARKIFLEVVANTEDANLRGNVYSRLLFSSLSDETLTPKDRFDLHCKFGNLFAGDFQAPLHQNKRIIDRRLKVGFISPNFNHHSVATFFLPVLEHFNQSEFELIAFSNSAIIDATTDKLKSLFTQWIDCRKLDDAALAHLIMQMQVDLLVDLAIHTDGNRILTLARKPAPIQATWLGYSGTSGISAIDYHITDSSMNPIALTDAVHTERLWRTEGPAAVFQPRGINLPPELPQANNPFTFGSLSQLMKLNAQVARVWSQILNAAPTAKLLIGSVNSDADAIRVTALFSPWLKDLEQLQLSPSVCFDDYLKLHRTIHVVLDTFPYTGGTTTGYALWMGVPVLTLDAQIAAPRMPGISLIRAAGLAEFIAISEDDYVVKALHLVANPALLISLRETLRNRLLLSDDNSPALLTRRLEYAFREMWRRWCIEQT